MYDFRKNIYDFQLTNLNRLTFEIIVIKILNFNTSHRYNIIYTSKKYFNSIFFFLISKMLSIVLYYIIFHFKFSHYIETILYYVIDAKWHTRSLYYTSQQYTIYVIADIPAPEDLIQHIYLYRKRENRGVLYKYFGHIRGHE